MANATIKIYRADGSANRPDRILIRTLRIETASEKRLTSKRAGRLLAREFPDFNGARNGMLKTDEGWMARRAIRPTEHCSFHYVWETALVTEDADSPAPIE
jgi:hypothetical protein